MKSLALALLCLSLNLHAGDRTTLPEAVNRVEPDYGALTTGYIVELADVEMTVDQKGKPFALKSEVGLPDSVVSALGQWRYRPYKKDGHDVPFATRLIVPVRRKLLPDVERGIRPSWSPGTQEMRDAIKTGEDLDAGKAAELARDLPRAEALGNPRTSLLVFYTKKGLIDARREVISWLIENYPQDDILGSPLGIVDPPGWEWEKRLWLAALKQYPNDTAVVNNAITFLRIADPQQAIQVLALFDKWRKYVPWMGNIYGLAALGVIALNPLTGEAVAAAPNGFRPSARQALLQSTNTQLVLSGMDTLIHAAQSLSTYGALPADFEEFCPRLLGHTKELYAATSLSCDLSSGEASIAEAYAFTGGQPAVVKLAKRVQPHYPADARSRGIQGTVEFLAMIDAAGEIEEIGFLSGPLALYPESRNAVRQWKYQITQRNGRPTPVITNITLHFTLGQP